MKRTSLLFWACLSLTGCGESSAPSRPATSEVELSFSDVWEIQEQPLSEPLTDEEVTSFIELVRLLPDGKPPELTPVPALEGASAQTPEEMVLAWRKTVRDALTVDTLMQGWSPRSGIRRALTERQVAPRALTSLMLRMSCALAVQAMGGSRSVAAQRVIAEDKVEALVARMHQARRQQKPYTDALADALCEAASLSEYLALLSEVPPESLVLVVQYKNELKAMLPVASNLSTISESREDHRIQPVSFEEPVKKPRR